MGLIENLSEPHSKATEFLLKSIASRLSGREDCRKRCYRVTINHNGVCISPMIYVYPDRYKRHEDDKIDIVSWVHRYKMSNTLLTNFVFGVYEYQMSVDGKKRKWRKIG